MIHPTPDQIEYMKAHASDDRRSWFIGVNVLCLVLAYFAVGLRVVSRLKIGTHIGLDDHLILVSALCLTGHVACLLVGVKLGMGRHAIFVSNLKDFAITNLVGQTFYSIMIGVIKLSILSLYARIFQRTKGWFKPVLWSTALLIILIIIPQCFAYVFQCVPIDSLWTEYAGPKYRVFCLNFQAVIVAFGVLNIITDWFILFLPIPVVWGLQLERRAKWSICSLFAVGFFTCVISIIRLFYSRRADNTTDPSWDYVHISLISSLEGAAGILAACMPTWRPLFKFLRHGINVYFSDKNRSTDNLNNSLGNTTMIGRGGWAERVRARSKSRSRSRGAKADHRGIGAGVPGVPGLRGMVGKRSESSMSGESIEGMLKCTEIEMVSQTPSASPSLPSTITTPIPPQTSNKKSSSVTRPRSQTFSFDGTPNAPSTYQAKAGSDRWEAIQRRQRLKSDNEERERGRTMNSDGAAWTGGGMIYGGMNMSTADEPETVRTRRSEDADGGRGLGIVVTKTVTSVTKHES